MQINYTGQGIDVTDALRNVIDKKFDKITRHFNNNIMSINVILHTQKLTQIIESNILVKGAEITANGQDENMYKAIDKMIAKLDKQLIKLKEKESNHRD